MATQIPTIIPKDIVAPIYVADYDPDTKKVLMIGVLPNVELVPKFNSIVLNNMGGVDGARTGDSVSDDYTTIIPHNPDSSEYYTFANRVVALFSVFNDKATQGVYFTPTGEEKALLFSTTATAQADYSMWYVKSTQGILGDKTIAILQDRTPITLSEADVKTLSVGVTNYVQACSANYATLYAKLQSDLTTDLTVGWPDNHIS